MERRVSLRPEMASTEYRGLCMPGEAAAGTDAAEAVFHTLFCGVSSLFERNDQNYNIDHNHNHLEAATLATDLRSSSIELPSDTGGFNSKYASRFYKTKMCPYLQQKGRCSKGAKCVYAHTKAELRKLPNLEKTKLCSQMKSDGKCDDEECNFAHSLEELRHTDNFYKTKLCHMWKKGKCSSGPLCRHAHGSEELRFYRSVARQGYYGQPKVVSSGSGGVEMEGCNHVSVAESQKAPSACSSRDSMGAAVKPSSVYLTPELAAFPKYPIGSPNDQFSWLTPSALSSETFDQQFQMPNFPVDPLAMGGPAVEALTVLEEIQRQAAAESVAAVVANHHSTTDPLLAALAGTDHLPHIPRISPGLLPSSHDGGAVADGVNRWQHTLSMMSEATTAADSSGAVPGHSVPPSRQQHMADITDAACYIHAANAMRAFQDQVAIQQHIQNQLDPATVAALVSHYNLAAAAMATHTSPLAAAVAVAAQTAPLASGWASPLSHTGWGNSPSPTSFTPYNVMPYGNPAHLPNFDYRAAESPVAVVSDPSNVKRVKDPEDSAEKLMATAEFAADNNTKWPPMTLMPSPPSPLGNAVASPTSFSPDSQFMMPQVLQQSSPLASAWDVQAAARLPYNVAFGPYMTAPPPGTPTMFPPSYFATPVPQVRFADGTIHVPSSFVGMAATPAVFPPHHPNPGQEDVEPPHFVASEDVPHFVASEDVPPLAVLSPHLSQQTAKRSDDSNADNGICNVEDSNADKKENTENENCDEGNRDAAQVPLLLNSSPSDQRDSPTASPASIHCSGDTLLPRDTTAAHTRSNIRKKLMDLAAADISVVGSGQATCSVTPSSPTGFHSPSVICSTPPVIRVDYSNLSFSTCLF